MTSTVSKPGASALWILLLTAASTVTTLLLACATPFPALAALAAVHMRRADGVALMLAAWAAAQAVGWFVLGYPHDPQSLAQAAAVAASAVGGTLLAGIAAVLTTLVLGMRQLLANGGMARLLGKLPGIGERVRIYELSRLYLTLGMLSEGGITIVHAIETVQGMVSAGMRQQLQNARAEVEAGMPLSTAFDASGLTTPISLRMLRVGERTGDMGPMLTQSAAFYDGEISRWIERFTRTFEPLLMAAIGLVVGAIVVLLYMPIFDLAGDMS